MSPTARLLVGEMMIHLGIENPFGQRLLQIVKQPLGLKGGSWVGAGQQLIEDGIRNTRFFASRHGRAPSFPSCPTPHAIPDVPGTMIEVRLDASKAPRFGAEAGPTGSFDAPLDAKYAICCCVRRPKGRSSLCNQRNPANVGLNALHYQIEP